MALKSLADTLASSAFFALSSIKFSRFRLRLKPQTSSKKRSLTGERLMSNNLAQPSYVILLKRDIV